MSVGVSMCLYARSSSARREQGGHVQPPRHAAGGVLAGRRSVLASSSAFRLNHALAHTHSELLILCVLLLLFVMSVAVAAMAVQLQVTGAKTWHVCPPSQSPFMYEAGAVDAFHPDYDRFPLFKNVIRVLILCHAILCVSF